MTEIIFQWTNICLTTFASIAFPRQSGSSVFWIFTSVSRGCCSFWPDCWHGGQSCPTPSGHLTNLKLQYGQIHNCDLTRTECFNKFCCMMHVLPILCRLCIHCSDTPQVMHTPCIHSAYLLQTVYTLQTQQTLYRLYRLCTNSADSV